MFSWPLKACPLKWGAQSRVSWNIYLQTVYIIKNTNDFYSSCSKQNFNMQRHPAMSEQNKKKIKTTYRVTIVNPDVSPTHRPMLHIFPINPRCLTVFLMHGFHRLCRGIHFFLIFDPKHRLWVLTCNHNQCYEQKYQNYHHFFFFFFFATEKKSL